jgi:very-short-patch-repair endonuclease
MTSDQHRPSSEVSAATSAPEDRTREFRRSESIIIRLASGQHGVVARRQLLGEGISAAVIARRVSAGLLEPLHRGVYRVGPVRAPHVVDMAAVLACGESTVLSHRSAGALWSAGALNRPDAVEVITSADRGRRHGIRACCIRTLRTDETTTLENIPITTPARTLVDLAAVVDARELERALALTLNHGLADAASILAVLDRHPRLHGAHVLRAMIVSETQPAFTRSEAEQRFLALLRKAMLPMPEANVRLAGYEVDFYWRAQRFVVEIDGFAFHASARMFESDRRRDAALAAAGVRVTRVTWRQMENEPVALLVRLGQALALVGSPRDTRDGDVGGPSLHPLTVVQRATRHGRARVPR